MKGYDKSFLSFLKNINNLFYFKYRYVNVCDINFNYNTSQNFDLVYYMNDYRKCTYFLNLLVLFCVKEVIYLISITMQVLLINTAYLCLTELTLIFKYFNLTLIIGKNLRSKNISNKLVHNFNF